MKKHKNALLSAYNLQSVGQKYSQSIKLCIKKTKRI